MEKAKKKEVTVIVNGREHVIDKKKLEYRELIGLAFENPPTGEFVCFTITFRNGRGNTKEGDVAEEDTVKVKNGTIFNVTATDKS